MKGTSHAVLIVDDDATLRRALESVLVSLGYRVLMTGEPDAAYAIAGAEQVDAAFVDVRLPSMSGISLYIALVHRCPALEGCIAFISGDADAADVRPWLERHRCAVFRKPFRPQQLTDWLDTALRARTAKPPVAERRATPTTPTAAQRFSRAVLTHRHLRQLASARALHRFPSV